jgi:hypothetical protein
MNARVSGLTWALVGCPVIGWLAAYYAEQSLPRGIGASEGFVLMAFVPAVLAGAGNALLGRDIGAVARACVLAASVCFGVLLLLVLLVFSTFDPQ